MVSEEAAFGCWNPGWAGVKLAIINEIILVWL